MAIEVIRILMHATEVSKCARITVRVNEAVAAYLNNKKRRELTDIEDKSKIAIQILGGEGLFPEHLEIDSRDGNGNQLKIS